MQKLSLTIKEVFLSKNKCYVYLCFIYAQSMLYLCFIYGVSMEYLWSIYG